MQEIYSEFDMRQLEESMLAHRNSAKMLKSQVETVGTQRGYERQLVQLEEATGLRPIVHERESKGHDMAHISGLSWHAKHKASGATGEIWVSVRYMTDDYQYDCTEAGGQGVFKKCWHTDTKDFFDYPNSVAARTTASINFYPDTGKDKTSVYALADYELALEPFEKVVKPSQQRVRGWLKRNGYTLYTQNSWRYGSEKTKKVRVADSTHVVCIRDANRNMEAKDWGEMRSKIEADGFKADYAQNHEHEFLGLDVYHWDGAK